MGLIDICRLLNKYNVDYLIIGGDAVAFYGVDRVSLDTDIWIKEDINNYKNIVKVLYEAGYISDNNKILDNNKLVERWYLLKKHQLNRFTKNGDKPVDILSHNIKYKKFESCFIRKNIIEIDGVRINFISLKDLIKLKKQAGRNKDLDDLEKLKNL